MDLDAYLRGEQTGQLRHDRAVADRAAGAAVCCQCVPQLLHLQPASAPADWCAYISLHSYALMRLPANLQARQANAQEQRSSSLCKQEDSSFHLSHRRREGCHAALGTSVKLKEWQNLQFEYSSFEKKGVSCIAQDPWALSCLCRHRAMSSPWGTPRASVTLYAAALPPGLSVLHASAMSASTLSFTAASPPSRRALCTCVTTCANSVQRCTWYALVAAPLAPPVSPHASDALDLPMHQMQVAQGTWDSQLLVGVEFDLQHKALRI